MSDKIKTDEQALAEGRGNFEIELPKAIEYVTKAAVAIGAIVNTDGSKVTEGQMVKLIDSFTNGMPIPNDSHENDGSGRIE